MAIVQDKTMMVMGKYRMYAIKRKIRNRLQDMGNLFLSNRMTGQNDGFKSLKERAEAIPELKKI